MLNKLKPKAIELRKQGLSYTEILQEIHVAKSTLSVWLRSVNLAQTQQQNLTQKRLEAALRGSKKRKEQRVHNEEKIKQQARQQILKIDDNNLLLIGSMLYWAEGAKSKPYRPTQGVIFSNSDPLMAKIFLRWLTNCLLVPSEQIVFEIYIHTNHSTEIDKVKTYWANITGFSINKFDRIYYKKHKPNSKRKNNRKNYYGLIRIRVKRSTNLNRKITGLIEGICQQCGVV